MLSIRQPCEFVAELLRLLSTKRYGLSDSFRDLSRYDFDDPAVIFCEGLSVSLMDTVRTPTKSVACEAGRTQAASKRRPKCPGDLAEI